jgi:hypothetical protein
MTEHERNLAAVHHVVHDYANLVSSGTMVVNGHHLGKGFEPPINTHLQHAFLVNCRKMYEFLLYSPSTNPKYDDIRAAHYLGRVETFDLSNWALWHESMNKQLLHVTFARVERPKQWEGYNENKLFLEEFMKAWTAFRGHLKGTVYEPQFESEIREKLKSEFGDLDLR